MSQDKTIMELLDEIVSLSKQMERDCRALRSLSFVFPRTIAEEDEKLQDTTNDTI